MKIDTSTIAMAGAQFLRQSLMERESLKSWLGDEKPDNIENDNQAATPTFTAVAPTPPEKAQDVASVPGQQSSTQISVSEKGNRDAELKLPPMLFLIRRVLEGVGAETGSGEGQSAAETQVDPASASDQALANQILATVKENGIGTLYYLPFPFLPDSSQPSFGDSEALNETA